jgi:hypothetical protein
MRVFSLHFLCMNVMAAALGEIDFRYPHTIIVCMKGNFTTKKLWIFSNDWWTFLPQNCSKFHKSNSNRTKIQYWLNSKSELNWLSLNSSRNMWIAWDELRMIFTIFTFFFALFKQFFFLFKHRSGDSSEWVRQECLKKCKEI